MADEQTTGMILVSIQPRSDAKITLDHVRQRYALDASELDMQFGLVLIDPDINFFILRVTEAALERMRGDDWQVQGPFADPVIGAQEPAQPRLHISGNPWNFELLRQIVLEHGVEVLLLSERRHSMAVKSLTEEARFALEHAGAQIAPDYQYDMNAPRPPLPPKL